MEALKSDARNQVSLSLLFNTPVMRHLSKVTPFIFLFVFTAYFGLTLRKVSLYYITDSLQILMIKGGLEIFATTVALTFPHTTEIVNLVVVTLIEGSLCLASALWPSKTTTSMVLFTVSRFFASVTNTSIAMTIATFYPTMIRMTGLGWGHTCVGISLLAATNAVNMGRWSESLPPVLFGACACIGSCLMLLLPSQLSQKTFDLVDQMEEEYAQERRLHDNLQTEEQSVNPVFSTKAHFEAWTQKWRSSRRGHAPPIPPSFQFPFGLMKSNSAVINHKQ